MNETMKFIMAIILLFDAIHFDFNDRNAYINPIGYIAFFIFLIYFL